MRQRSRKPILVSAQGKPIATEAVKSSKVSDSVKPACVLGAVELPVHAPPQPSHKRVTDIRYKYKTR